MPISTHPRGDPHSCDSHAVIDGLLVVATPWSKDFVLLSNSAWRDAAQNDLFAALDNADGVGPHGFGNTHLIAVPSWSGVSFAFPLQWNNANSADLGWINVTQSSAETAWAVFSESTIPEPSNALLLILGLMGLVSVRRR